MLSSDSDESTIEFVNERAGVRLRPQRTHGQEEPLNLCYNLRQNRRQTSVTEHLLWIIEHHEQISQTLLINTVVRMLHEHCG